MPELPGVKVRGGFDKKQCHSWPPRVNVVRHPFSRLWRSEPAVVRADVPEVVYCRTVIGDEVTTVSDNQIPDDIGRRPIDSERAAVSHQLGIKRAETRGRSADQQEQPQEMGRLIFHARSISERMGEMIFWATLNAAQLTTYQMGGKTFFLLGALVESVSRFVQTR
jgi:hypothetical protein